MYIIVGISVEFIYLVNLVLIIAVRNKQNNMHYYFFTYLKFNNFYQGFVSLINLISLIPTHFIVIVYLKYKQDPGVSQLEIDIPKVVNLILVTKLLRYVNIKEFLAKFEHLIKFLDFNKLTFFRIFVTLLQLLQIIHLFACCFVFYNIYIGSGYFSITQYDVSGDYIKYVIGLEWAVESMIGSCFGDVYPHTDGEIFLTFFSMIAGAVFYCKIFSDFNSIIQINQQFTLELRDKEKQAYFIANNKQVSQRTFEKIQYFYNNFEEGQKILMYYSIIKELPSQLKQEVLQKFQQSLVQKVQIFNLGQTEFVNKMIQKMYPQVAVKDDFVLKMGESAQDFFILAKGKVEIINRDKKKVIRVLEPGAYFGEIAILINQHRTCFAKAQNDCIFMCIKKDDFLGILNQFPQIKNFLIKVAQQRMGTINYEENNQNRIIDKIQTKKLNFYSKIVNQDSNDSLVMRRMQILTTQNNNQSHEDLFSQKTIQNNTQNNQLQTINNEEESFMGDSIYTSFKNEHLNRKIKNLKQQKNLKVLILNSQAMFCWAMVLLLCLTYNLFYSLYSIFFSDDLQTKPLLLIETLSFFINLIDSVIFSKLSTFSKKNKDFILNNKQILFKYLNKEFFFDVLATVPFPNIYELVCGENEFMDNMLFIRLFRLLRLIKFRRLQQYIYILQEQYKTNFKYGTFFKLAYVYFFLNHLNACIMYIICKFEYDRNLVNSLGFQMNITSIRQERPFMYTHVYINFLYWSFCVSTQGAYGDISAISAIEKTYQNIVNVFFKIFFCYVFANLASINTVSKNMREQYLEELDSFKYWSKLIGLPSEIENRIIKIYNYRWNHQKGVDEKQLEESLLPDSIKNKMMNKRMKFIIQLVNPLQNQKLMSIQILFLKRFEKVLITQGEYVFKKGDLAEEIYFIEEGIVQIINIKCSNNNKKEEEILAEISSQGYFGGIEFINEVPSLRKVSARAKTNISLFLLTMEKYSQFISEYPDAKLFIKNIYRQTSQNKKKKKQFDDQELQNNIFSQNKQKEISQNFLSFESIQINDLNEDHYDNNQTNLNKEVNSKLKIQLIQQQEKYINLNKQIIYRDDENEQTKYYNDLIGSVIQTQLLEQKVQFQVLSTTEKKQNKKNAQNSLLFEQEFGIEQNKNIKENNEEMQKNLSNLTNSNQSNQIQQKKQNKSLSINKIAHSQFEEQQQQNTLKYIEDQGQTQIQDQKRLSLIYFDDSNDFTNYQKQQNINVNIQSLNSQRNPSQNQIIVINSSSISSSSSSSSQHKQPQIQYNFNGLGQTNNNNQSIQVDNYFKQKEKTVSLEDILQYNKFQSKEENIFTASNTSFVGENQQLLFSTKNNQKKFQFDQQGLTNQLQKATESEQFNIDFNQNDLSFLGIQLEISDNEKVQKYFNQNYEFQDQAEGISKLTQNYDILFEANEIEQILETINFQSEFREYNFDSDQNEFEQIQKNIDIIETDLNIISNQQNVLGFNNSYQTIKQLDKTVSYSQLSISLEETIIQNKFNEFNEEQNIIQKQEKLTQTGNKLSCLFIRAGQIFSKIDYLISFNQLYFTIIIPLNLAFQYFSFANPILIAIEILVIINELRYFLQLINSYKNVKVTNSKLKATNSQNQQNSSSEFKEQKYSLKILKKKQDQACLMVILEVLLLVPFSVIFDLIQIEELNSSFEITFLKLIRIIPYFRIFNIFSKLKKKNIYLYKVIETLILYILLCHVLGCIFILLGKIESDFNSSWMIKVPAPQKNFPKNIRAQLNISNESLYLHAIYWAYVTTSHVGVGDVTGVNLREKVFSILVMYISTFTHIIFFGNLASMAKEAAFVLKIKLEQKYEKIFQTISLFNLTSFKIQLDTYINFIWNDSYGLDENQILEKIPFSLKVEIFKNRYKNCINQTFIFKSNSWQVDMDIVHSILRFMKVKIFLSNDIIAEAGKSYEDLYIFLQGKYVAYQLNGKKAFEASVGDFFGGSQTDSPLTIYYQAKTICKVGVIDKQYVKYLQQIFPDWYEKIIDKQKKINQNFLFDLSFFQEDYYYHQEKTQNRFIVNNKNQLIDFSYSVKLLDHYKYVATSFFEVEVAVDNDEDNKNNLQNIQILNQINTTEEDDSESEGLNKEQNPNEVSIGIKKSLQQANQNNNNWAKKNEDRKRSVLFEFQNISIHKSNFFDDSSQKSDSYHRPFIICLPYKAQASSKSTLAKDMIILHFNYIYKLAFIKDSKYNYFLHPYSSASYYVQLINLLFTIYSLIFTPIYVCFEVELSTLPLVFEVIHTVYQFIELFIDLRTPYFKQGLLVTNSKKILSYLWEKSNFKLRIACLLPLNLIFWQVSLDYQERSFVLKLIFLLLRGIRLLQIFNLDSILVRIQTHNKSKQKALGMLVGFLHVLIIWHYFSSLWIWYVYNISAPQFPQSNWVDANNLQNADLISKILNGLFFVMSIATTCGYPNMKSYNDIERIFFIFTIYFGNAIIAYDFGLIAAQSLLLPEKYQEIDKKIKQFKILLNIGNDNNKNINLTKLHKKIELSYLYKLYSNVFIEDQLKQIRLLIPQTLYDQLLYSHQAKYLQKIPLLLELSKFSQFRNIQKHIELKVFLPYDYIIKKDSKNGNLCFVSKGNVNILSPKEDAVIHTLYEGDFFSSVTLTKYGKTTSCRIFTSNIAEIVQIKHKNVKLMFEIFPEFQNTIYKHARRQICVPIAQNQVRLNLLSDYQEEAFSQINTIRSKMHTKFINKDFNDNINIFFTQDYEEQQIFKNFISSKINFLDQKQQQVQSEIQIRKKSEFFHSNISEIQQQQFNEIDQVQISQIPFSQESIFSDNPGFHIKRKNNVNKKKQFLLEDDDGCFQVNNPSYQQTESTKNVSDKQICIDPYQRNNQQQNIAFFRSKSSKNVSKKYHPSYFKKQNSQLNQLKEDLLISEFDLNNQNQGQDQLNNIQKLNSLQQSLIFNDEAFIDYKDLKQTDGDNNQQLNEEKIDEASNLKNDDQKYRSKKQLNNYQRKFQLYKNIQNEHEKDQLNVNKNSNRKFSSFELTKNNQEF
ncbi:cyclic nucleotide-binding domain protein (macronuclear) [Tetrahymena thermophila SB210]|uniref:Cyclic nucleotide-binding domain protein n=1 Tax=Tetrahymena thermophila (strain SB210) TaxID=312017 RepID=I7MMY3_TETTS|nr:cyclic nucleotide-binding domain protein [Tetrahymena thermophila SB210]EAS07210.2 cyclic nucleotide-binding domain protein [Tetrahymena thermophila SB210]|eukprot:XP_001027452.2 cyclic nucleotide-binding domain protein [Tetrahymena thermophila SB210]